MKVGALDYLPWHAQSTHPDAPLLLCLGCLSWALTATKCHVLCSPLHLIMSNAGATALLPHTPGCKCLATCLVATSARLMLFDGTGPALLTHAGRRVCDQARRGLHVSGARALQAQLPSSSGTASSATCTACSLGHATQDPEQQQVLGARASLCECRPPAQEHEDQGPEHRVPAHAGTSGWRRSRACPPPLSRCGRAWSWLWRLRRKSRRRWVRSRPCSMPLAYAACVYGVCVCV